MQDARTTPPGLRIPVLLGLVAWVGYFLACGTAALDTDAADWQVMGRWQMFTVRNDRWSDIRAEGEVAGAWQPIVLPALFPTRSESGYRYEGFEGSDKRLGVLAAATCGRSADHPAKVRIYAQRHRLQIGRPATEDHRKDLLTWDCADTVQLPKGVPW